MDDSQVGYAWRTFSCPQPTPDLASSARATFGAGGRFIASLINAAASTVDVVGRLER